MVLLPKHLKNKYFSNSDCCLIVLNSWMQWHIAGIKLTLLQISQMNRQVKAFLGLMSQGAMIF